MRVVGGKHKNRRIHPPPGMDARPTTDFAKEGLFNVLQHSIALEGIRVLDLFAGTGSISLEFLSRGADEVVSVDHDRKLFEHMQRTATELKETGWRMVKSDVFAFLTNHRSTYDIVFADPPFDMEGIERIPTLVQRNGLLGSEGVLILEHHEKVDLSALPGYQRTRTYGLIHFSFFGPLPNDSEPTT
ncbi:MAG: 16S rRNA (guanine(966)-N(2))-methyltransferase RsmD [Flavobacteriales bacterium]